MPEPKNPSKDIRDALARLLGLRKHLEGEVWSTFYFAEDDFYRDFYFSFVLSTAPQGGSSIGEAYAVARRIDAQEGLDAWETEWSRMAQRVEGIADEALEDGHEESARETYLRAAMYYRTALFFMQPTREPRYKRVYQNAKDCFQTAAELVDPPIEMVTFPFEDGEVTGYFQPAAADDEPRPTILQLGGGDSVMEDMYYFTGPPGRRRGYNMVFVDTPGQGATALDGMIIQPDSERAISTVLDVVLDRPDVDPEAFGVVGPSLGGHLLPRAACHDDRIKACVANNILTDMHAFLDENPFFWWLAKIEETPAMSLLRRVGGEEFAVVEAAMDNYRFRFGVKNTAAWLERMKEFQFDPSEIGCPTLLLVGEEEYDFLGEVRRQHDEALQAIDQPRTKEEILPSDLGAGGHSGVGNLPYTAQRIFDWFDEVFDHDG